MSELQTRYEANPDEENVVIGWYSHTKRKFSSMLTDEPAYAMSSRTRDKWLSEIWKLHPMMAGVISSMVERDKNRGWSLTGAYSTVKYTKEMLHKADRGAGWREYVGQQALNYYVTDFGAATQAYRNGKRVKIKANPDGSFDVDTPPMSALFTFDSTRLALTGNWKKPAEYYDPGNMSTRKVPYGELLRFCSMRDPREEYNGLGFSFMSRTIQLLKQMLLVLDHYEEVLAGKVQRGFVTVKGVSQAQFNEALGGFNEAVARIGGEAFNGVVVLANDGGRDVEVKFTPVSQLPENFEPKAFYELMMMGLALCAGFPADEFWQISTGRGYGRGMEMENLSARAGDKGRNAFAIAHQEQLQADGVLPARVQFEYYRYDVGERLQQAEMRQAWANVLKTYLELQIPVEAVHRIGVEESALPAWVTVAKEKSKANDIQSEVEGSGEGVAITEEAIGDTVEPVEQIREKLLDDFDFREKLLLTRSAYDEPIVRYDWNTDNGGWSNHKITDLWGSAEEALKRKSFASAAV